MPHLNQLAGGTDLDAEFLQQLALQRLSRRFPLFQFASREFPQPALMHMSRPLRYQDPATGIAYRCRCNMNTLLFRHKR